MAYILEKIGNTYNLPKKYFTCDAKSDLDGISLIDVPIGSEAYCILEEESYILDSNKQWHKKKIGEDLTGQVQADLSQTDSTQADYVKGVLRTEHLPEGYPYKEIGTILDGTFEFIDINGIYFHEIIDEDFTIVDSKSYTVIWDGITYQCIATIFMPSPDQSSLVLGNLGIMGMTDTGEPFLFVDQGNGQKAIGTNDTAATHTITVSGEVTCPIAPEYLPKGYPHKEQSKTVFFEWNGYIGDKENIDISDILGQEAYYVKVSDTVLQKEVFVGAVITDSSGESITISSENLIDITGGYAVGLEAIIMVSDKDIFNFNSIKFPSNGLWTFKTITNSGKQFYYASVIRTTKTIYPMSEEYLPDKYITETELASKGYLTSETDPTVPAWAKAKTKPSYDFSELTINDPEAAKTVLAIENGMILKNLQAAMPSSENWHSVTYGNGKFVAVAFASYRSAYSEDGINWILSTIIGYSQKSWRSVTYGNGKFVVVADESNPAYSEDGINWTESTMPSTNNWYSVAYGNGKFVAVAYGSDKAVYSEDGINWTVSTMPSSNYWRSVTYGNGKFVAVAYKSNKAAYSEDGINWTESTMPSANSWYSVAYGNGKFVAVAVHSNPAYSEDGINWTSSTMPKSLSCYSVTYGDGKFVAVVYNSNQSVYSEDGINWTLSAMPSSADWYSVTYGDGKFVAVAEGSIQAAYSEDGITWKSTFEYLSQNNSDITESVRSIINKSIYETIVGVPACTTADNGKVLKVVDGVPTWVEA